MYDAPFDPSMDTDFDSMTNEMIFRKVHEAACCKIIYGIVPSLALFHVLKTIYPPFLGPVFWQLCSNLFESN